MKKLILILLVLSLTIMLSTSAVIAIEFPERSPTCVIGYAAGGGTDTAIRPIIVEMEKYWDRPITVVNMEGASSAVAGEYVLERPADGYWWFGTGHAGVAVTLRLMGFLDTSWRDWETFMTLSGPDGIIVHKDSDIETIDDFVELMRAEETIIGVTGLGTSTHIYMEEFLNAIGAQNRTYVPHGGCHPTSVAVLRKEVKYAPITLSAGWEFIRSGDVRVLAVFGMTEPLLVELADGSSYSAPNVGQVHPDAAPLDDLIKTWPFFVKRDVPIEIRDEIRKAFLWACEQPSVHEAAKKSGLMVSGIIGEEADRLMSIAESSWGWLMYEAGETDMPPEEYVPRPEDWSWPPEGWDMSQYPMVGE